MSTQKPDFTARSVMLGSERLGIIAKMDLIEGEDGTVTPVDTKKGKRPHVAEGAYEPERVQVCAQALILEDAGYKVAEGAIWYAGSRERVRIALDEALRATTRAAISELRLAAAAGRLPPPLVDSPKCAQVLARRHLPARRGELLPARAGAAPAQSVGRYRVAALRAGARRAGVANPARCWSSRERRQKTEVALGDVSELVLHGPVALTTPALGALLREEIPVTYASSGGWVLGHTVSTGHQQRRHSHGAIPRRLRRAPMPRICAQPGRGEDPQHARVPAPQLQGRDRIKSGKARPSVTRALEALSRLADRAPHAPTEAELLGLEGEAAARYFRLFATMFGDSGAGLSEFCLRQADAATAGRSGQRDALARLFAAHAHLADHALGRGLRSLSRLLSPAAFRPAGARTRHDGAIPADPLRTPPCIQVINNGEVKAGRLSSAQGPPSISSRMRGAPSSPPTSVASTRR